MSGFYGADTAALRGHAVRVQTGSTRLEELRATLSAQIGAVDWIGPDAEAFRDDFTSRVSGLFTQVTSGLDGRRGELDQHAEEQDQASDTGSDGGGGGDRSFGDLLGDLLANPLTSVLATGASVLSAGAALWEGFKQGRNLLALRQALAATGPAAQAAQTFIRSGMVDDAAGLLGKLGTAGRFLGGAGGVLSIASGISDMINPPHDGWRGVGDRVAGGLSVVSGAGGLAIALGAGAALGPVGLGVVAVAGIGAGLWAAGNAIYDNWDSITGFASDVGGTVSDFASDVGDTVSGAADAVGDFVGGLF